MEGWGPLFEIMQFLDNVRGHAADLFGPLAPVVTGAGQILAAGVAIFALIAGKSFWAPPTPDLSNYAVRFCGLVAAIGIVALYVWSKNGGSAWNFIAVAFIAIAVGIIGAIVYLFLRLLLCFHCEGDAALYARGVWLNKFAKKVLNNDLTGLPPQYQLKNGQVPPTDAYEYFCKSGKIIGFVWTRTSHALALLLLFLGYFTIMVPTVIALASASLALSQPQVEVKKEAKTEIVELPSDILFDSNKAEIRPGAAASLDRAAAIMRERGVKSARVEGYTDSIGSPEHNQKLSEMRAEAVRKWLVDKAGLVNVRFDVVGFGATHPAAPNVNADGSDNPEGRRKNRRVAIVFATSA
jgi:outer membrane protein OmpA-like peptidoglycan-associated protein